MTDEAKQLREGLHDLIKGLQEKQFAVFVEKLSERIEITEQKLAALQAAPGVKRKLAHLDAVADQVAALSEAAAKEAHSREQLRQGLEARLAAIEEQGRLLAKTPRRHQQEEERIQLVEKQQHAALQGMKSSLDALGTRLVSLEERTHALAKTPRLHEEENALIHQLEKQQQTARDDLKAATDTLAARLSVIENRAHVLSQSRKVEVETDRQLEKRQSAIHDEVRKSLAATAARLEAIEGKTRALEKIPQKHQEENERIQALEKKLTFLTHRLLGLSQKAHTLADMEKEVASTQESAADKTAGLVHRIRLLEQSRAKAAEAEDKRADEVAAKIAAFEKRLDIAVTPEDVKKRVTLVEDGTVKRAEQLEKRIARLEKSAHPEEPLVRRLRDLEGQLRAVPDAEPLKKKLADMEETVAALAKTATRLAALENTLEARVPGSLGEKLVTLERRLHVLEKVPDPADRLTSLEKRLVKLADLPADVQDLSSRLKGLPQVDADVVKKLAVQQDSLHRRLGGLEHALNLHKQEVKQKLGAVQPAVPPALENAVDVLGKRLAGVEGSLKKVAAVEAEMALLERAGIAARSRQSLKKRLAETEGRMGKRIQALERDLVQVSRTQTPLTEKVAVMAGRLHAVEADAKSRADELTQLVTPKLEDLDRRLQVPLAEQQAAQKDQEHAIQALQKRLAALAADLSGKVAQEDLTLLKHRLSAVDALLHTKINSRFVHSLESLEREIEDKIRAHNKIFEEMRRDMGAMRREVASKKALEDLETQVVKPVEEMDRKLRAFVKEEVAKLEKDLRRTVVMEKVDAATLQREIESVVKEVEHQRTRSLESEIEGILKEGERMKRKDV
ncbi:MAG: hypothetical protein HY369_02950 [Candidatus Aenigmarchaeota archaeon]|nr:hypothetical protein [Candidatus Aenigmarchaeota archaeon]